MGCPGAGGDVGLRGDPAERGSALPGLLDISVQCHRGGGHHKGLFHEHLLRKEVEKMALPHRGRVSTLEYHYLLINDCASWGFP